MDPVLMGSVLTDVLRAQGRRMRYREDRRMYLVILLGGSLGILAALAIVVCAALVAAGETFISGTEVLEAAIYTLLFSGFIAGSYAILGRSRIAAAQPEITTEERLAAAKAAALLASELPQRRLEGALQLEALAQVRPDLVAQVTQALTGLVTGSYMESNSYPRYVVLAAIQALSRLNPSLRDQGKALDLQYATLAGLDLSGLDLRGANLTGADLVRSNLADANLTGTNLAGARLDGADLSQAELAYANLEGISVDPMTLAVAHLEGTLLPGIDGEVLP
jgi:uncharacterized protein YjbI with pentapeptide repeats